jgi:hypothetical protein
MATPALPPISAEAKELVQLCRAGRLYEIEKWIAAGKSMEAPVAKNRKSKTLLQIAIETGFHSLVGLIAYRRGRSLSIMVSLMSD